jgi:nucleotidyltransferase/DNA polymerase involved in DNA repair
VPRLAALRIPRFPIAAHWLQLERRHDAHWDTLPIGLMRGIRLACVSAAAARHQVRAGMTVAQARSKCAALDLLPSDDGILARELARATAALLTASPQVSPVPGAPGLWWVGAEGFEALGGDGVLAAALRDIARVWHPRARVAIADSAVAALAATWAHGAAAATNAPPVIIAPGGDAAYLAQVPLTLIPMDAAMREALRALGITTGGALAALDASEVERRWGTAGVDAWRLARGDDARRAALLRGDPQRSASAELGLSTTNTEPLLFLVRGALERLVPELRRDGRAIAALSITLTLDDGRPGHTITREARAARPLARVAPLFERCRALLDGWALPAPVSAVELRVVATAALSGEQGDLLRPTWRDPSAAESALERLRAAGVRVLRGTHTDRWGADRAGAWVEEVSAPSTARPVLPAVHRLLPVPAPTTVHCEHGRPVSCTLPDGPMRFLTAVGPERIAGEWWMGPQAARDYWRCVEAGAPHRELLLARETQDANDVWYVLGWRD